MLVGNAILIPLVLNANLWAAALPPTIFIVGNYLMCKKGVWEEWIGIITYPISILLLTILGYTLDPLYLIVPTLILTYGDALASIVGRLFFKTEQKSMQGSFVMFTVSIFICAFFFSVQTAFSIALLCTLIEGSKWDNLTVPLAASGMIFLLR